jgi:hypothetical protein
VLVVISWCACLEPIPLGAALDAGPDAGPWRCTPLTCAGCCSNNICRGGNEFLACGYDGRACRECAGDTSCVSPGTCASNPRDGGTLVRPLQMDGGLTDPFTGGIIQPPTTECHFMFGQYVCS